MKTPLILFTPLFMFSSCFFSGSTPTFEDLEDAKIDIYNSFENISDQSTEIPEELKEGYNEIQALINEEFGWFSNGNLKTEKSNTVQVMEANLKKCKDACQELNEELENLNDRTEIYFDMLSENLELQPENLRRKQKRKISEVQSKLDDIYKKTEYQIENLNEQVVEFEGIVAYLRGDLALDIVESKTFKELEEVSIYSDELVIKINENIEKGKELISIL